MLNQFLILYTPTFPKILVSILDEKNYNIKKYLIYVWMTKDYSKVLSKHSMKKSTTYKSYLLILKLGMALQIISGLSLIYLGITSKVAGGVAFGLATIIIYPILWSLLITIFVAISKINLSLPSN